MRVICFYFRYVLYFVLLRLDPPAAVVCGSIKPPIGEWAISSKVPYLVTIVALFVAGGGELEVNEVENQRENG